MGDNVLMELNREVCKAEVSAVQSAIAMLSAAPAKIDFYSIAAASGISRSTLYRNPVLREMVESARGSQLDPWELVRGLQEENAGLRNQLLLADSAKCCSANGAVVYSFVRFLAAA